MSNEILDLNKEQNQLVDYDRFKQKREEKITPPAFPDEIRGEPIDFEKAKAAFSQKIEVKVKQEQNPETNAGLSVDDFEQVAGKVEQMFLATVAQLEHSQSAILERLKQNNPDPTAFLQQKDYLDTLQGDFLDMLKDYKEKIKQIMLVAQDKKELEEITEAFRQFTAKIPLVS